MRGKSERLSIVFISTLLTPHQIPFCQEINNLCEDFTFYQVNDVNNEWVSKGETIRKSDYCFLQQFSKSEECEKKIINADIVLIGGCDLSLVKKRLKAGKIVFVYLERFYKKGISIKNFVRCIVGTYMHHGKYQKYDVNLLCASAYCAGDAAIFGNYKNRTYKWGYYTKFEESKLNVDKNQNQIIWVGRLIDWKHAEYAVEAMAEIVKHHPDVVLKIYGDGNEKKNLYSLIKQLRLENNVKIMGAVSSENVRQEMKQSAVFLSTSDYQEGWGAVINEAMNCRCAVVASHAAGSTPFMIKNGVNGYIYQCGDVQKIADLCKILIENTDLCKKISENAYRTIRDIWNPKQAAERFIELSKALLNGNKTPFYDDGPCSIAQPIRQKEMYEYIMGDENEKAIMRNSSVSE